jgi:4'-phosphopantetheinyl transferase
MEDPLRAGQSVEHSSPGTHNMSTSHDASLFELPLDAVHVWYVFTDRITDPDILTRYADIMSAGEHARRNRFVFAKDRHRFLVTRGLLRTLLSRYAHVGPEECVFVTNGYGKPFLHHPGAAHPGLEFNVSHTNGLVAIAITLGRDVGIDVEEVSRARVDLDVRQCFSAAEIATLQALPQSEQRSRFFDYWTLKEAYIKARGMGLSLRLDGFSILLDRARPPAIAFGPAIDDAPSTWQFVQFDPSSRHRMALAIRRRGSDVTVRITEFETNDKDPE